MATKLQLLEQACSDFSNVISERKGERNSLLRLLEEKQAELTKVEENLDIFHKVNKIYDLASVYARSKAKKTMEDIVTSALEIVFPGDLRFDIEMESKGDKAEANCLVTSTYGGNLTVTNEPQEARGGGVVDVISLALRVALFETSKPKIKGPLILDEPGKHVSEEYSKNVAAFLNMVVQTFGRQIIMVTHNQHLAEVGTAAFEVHMEQGESKVTPKFNIFS